MKADGASGPVPDWRALYLTAESQAGYFTTSQAMASGYSPPLLHKYLKNGRVKRVRRGIYRLVHFPPSEESELVVLWLWSEHCGVFSHQTALMLHRLSDALPPHTHMTVPASWSSRRLRVPNGLVLHFADIPSRDWIGAVPVTPPQRTLEDCVDAHVSPEFVISAMHEAAERSLITKRQAKTIEGRLADATSASAER